MRRRNLCRGSGAPIEHSWGYTRGDGTTHGDIYECGTAGQPGYARMVNCAHCGRPLKQTRAGVNGIARRVPMHNSPTTAKET